jgi:hypothetical protein
MKPVNPPPPLHPTAYRCISTAHTTDPDELGTLLTGIHTRLTVADRALAEKWFVNVAHAPGMPPPGRIRDLVVTVAEARGISAGSVFVSADLMMLEKFGITYEDDEFDLIIVGTPEQTASTLAAAELLMVAQLGARLRGAAHRRGPALSSPTILIDEFSRSLGALPEDEREMVLGALRTPRSAAASDQITAAAKLGLEYSALLVEAGRVAQVRDFDVVPGWAQLDVTDAVVGWFGGTCRTCACAPSPDRPQPVVAATWSPGLVTCAQCSHVLDAAFAEFVDTTCDACGFVGSAELIRRVAVIAGPLNYLTRLCENCYAAWPPEAS